MVKSIHHLIISILLIPILSGLVLGSEISFIGVESSTNLYQDITIVMNDSVNNFMLYYKRPNDLQWYNTSGQGNNFTIPANFIQTQGVYHFYVNNTITSQRIPSKGYFYTIITDNHPIFDQAINNYGTNDSSSGCQVINNHEFICTPETTQSSQIKRFALLHYLTKNNDYLELSYNLLINNWTSGATYSSNRCDPNRENDYNCGVSFDMQGAERQGLISSALFDSYSYTRNNSFKAYAINFVKGNSTTCNVWENNFNCTIGNNTLGDSYQSSRAQGNMILAYAKAYKHTNDLNYYYIMSNLSKFVTDNSDYFISTVDLVMGLSEAYLITLNEEYRLYAENYALKIIDECILTSCSQTELLSQSRLIKYIPYIISYNKLEVTVDNIGQVNLSRYSYSMNKILNLSSKILDLCANSQCSSALNQALATLSSYYSSRILPNSSIGFYGNNYLGRNETHLFFNVKYSSILTNPKLYYKDSNQINFDYVNLSNLGNGIIEYDFSTDSVLIEYYFEDDNGYRFPESNNVFTHVIPVDANTIPDVKNKLELFSSNPSLSYCNIFNNDFSCRYEFWQGNYIAGLSYAANYNSSLLEFITSLSNSIIDQTGLYSTCDPYNYDFFCSVNQADIANILKTPIFRAMSLVYGYTNYYFVNISNQPIKYSKNFVYLSNSNSFSDCNIWDNNFTCNSPHEQYKYISAIRNLYDITGDQTLYFKLFNLSESLYDLADDMYVAKSFLKLYDLFGNETSKNRIINFINDTESECHGGNCSVDKFYNLLSLTWIAYGVFEDDTSDVNLVDIGNFLFNDKPKSSFQDYCIGTDTNSVQHFTCINPLQQYKAIKSYYDILENYLERSPKNFSVSIDLNITQVEDDLYSAYLNEYINATCYVTNNDDISTFVDISLTTDFTIIGDNTIRILGVAASETVSASFIVNATRANLNQITCSATLQNRNTTNIDVFFKDTITTLINTSSSFLNEENNYSINFSLFNYFNFPINDIEIDLLDILSIANLVNITSNFNDDFIWDSTKIIIPRIFSNSYFNFTIEFSPFQSYDDNLSFNLSSAYNGSNFFSFPIIIDYDSFDIITLFNVTSRLYEPKTGVFIINNTKGFDINNLNITIYSNESKINITNITYISSSDTLMFNNNNYLVDSFLNQELINISIDYYLLKDSLNDSADISIIFESDNIYEIKTISLSSTPDILSLSINSIEGYVDEIKNLTVTLTDILYINQTNVTIEIDYDNSSIEIIDEDIILPSISEYIITSNNINSLYSSIFIDPISGILNISNDDDLSIRLYTDNYNSEFFLQLNSSHPNINESISNITYDVFLNQSSVIPDDHILEAELKIFNNGLEVLSQNCDITLFPHRCEVSSIFNNDVDSVLNLYLRRLSPINLLETISSIDTITSNYGLNSASALLNLSNFNLGTVTLSDSYHYNNYINITSIHTNISSNDMISIEKELYLSSSLPINHIIKAELFFYNESDYISSVLCNLSDNFICKNDLLSQDNFNSTLKISLERLLPYNFTDDLSIASLSSNLDVNQESAIINISNNDNLNFTFTTNSSIESSYILLEIASNINQTILSYPFVNVSFEVHKNNLDIPQNHTINLTIELSDDSNIIKSEECIFSYASDTVLLCSIITTPMDNLNIMANLSFNRNDTFIEPVYFDINYINISQSTFDNQINSIDINYINITQYEYNLSYIDINFVNVTHLQENKTDIANFSIINNTLISLFFPKVTNDKEYSIYIPVKILNPGNVFFNSTSFEGGFFESNSTVVRNTPLDDTSTDGPGSGGGSDSSALLIPPRIVQPSENITEFPSIYSSWESDYTISLDINRIELFSSYSEYLGILFDNYIDYYKDELIELYDCLGSYKRIFNQGNDLDVKVIITNNCDHDITFYFMDNTNIFSDYSHSASVSDGLLLYHSFNPEISNDINIPRNLIMGNVTLRANQNFILNYKIGRITEDYNSMLAKWSQLDSLLFFVYYDDEYLMISKDDEVLKSGFDERMLYIIMVILLLIILIIAFVTYMSIKESRNKKLLLVSDKNSKINDAVLSLGMHSFYINRLINEKDYKAALAEYNKAYSNYLKYKKEFEEISPEVRSMLDEELVMLTKLHQILQNNMSYENNSVTSSPKNHESTQSDQVYHYEYDILIRIKAVNIDLLNKDYLKAHKALEETKKLFLEIDEIDLHGHKVIFEKMINYLDKRIMPHISNSFRFKFVNFVDNFMSKFQEYFNKSKEKST
ncbi:MAG: hypothetical protein ACMXYG_03640 [Candidatus Woesearchaeota archaeon]